MTLVHTVNDAITAILGAMLPTLQVRFDAGPTTLAVMVGVFWIASSVTQPVFGALGEDIGLRVIGCVGVLMASTFLSLIGVASELWLVFVLLVIGGLGSAALHPVGTTIASSQASNATLGVGLFTAGGMVGFALGPVLILYLVSTYGTDATVWLAVPGLILGAACGPSFASVGTSSAPAPSAVVRSAVGARPGRVARRRGHVQRAGVRHVHRLHPALARARKRVLTRRADHRMDALSVRLRGRPRLDPRRLPCAQARPRPHDRRSTPPDPLPITRGDRQRARDSPLLRGDCARRHPHFRAHSRTRSSSRRSSCRAHRRRHQEWFSGSAQPWLGSRTSCSGAFRRRLGSPTGF